MTARKHFIDNLRWITLMLLIPYHTAMAWNAWGEPNYVFFESNKVISSFIVFFSPFFMPLLFVLAGVSTKYALRKRSFKQYLSERAKKLLIPLLFGTVVLIPVMTYLADRHNLGYSDGFFEHYGIFFTRFTDLTGADGGFSLGQFWFLLYLFVISVICVSIMQLFKNRGTRTGRPVPFPLFIALGLPLPLFGEFLSIGGKSIAEYTYLFLLGYFLFSDDGIIQKAEKYCLPLLAVGTAAAILDVYLFLWSDTELALINTAAKYIAEWFMMTALVGLSKKYLNFTGKISAHMSGISFLYYIWHFICVVSSQILLYRLFGNNTAVLYFGTVIVSFPLTILLCEISIRIPFLCFLTGTKHKKT